jgi:hypothetical protein
MYDRRHAVNLDCFRTPTIPNSWFSEARYCANAGDSGYVRRLQLGMEIPVALARRVDN